MLAYTTIRYWKDDWIRRNSDTAQLYADNMEYGHFLNLAVQAQAGYGNPGNLFRLAGIDYEGRMGIWEDEEDPDIDIYEGEK